HLTCNSHPYLGKILAFNEIYLFFLLFHCLLLPQLERKEQSIETENNTILLLARNTQLIQIDSPFYIVPFFSTTTDL
ncbi:hypothetical protein, partial [Escherichia coli]|uniref:hypothetical protein n=1 Tax=Escherichia coli TaxID=562 RepID=UPI00321ACEF4